MSVTPFGTEVVPEVYWMQNTPGGLARGASVLPCKGWMRHSFAGTVSLASMTLSARPVAPSTATASSV